MIFGSIKDSATESGEALTLFQKKFSDVIKDYQRADAGKIGEGKLQAALSGTKFGFSKTDIEAFKQYNSLIDAGYEKTDAMAMAMGKASSSAKNFVRDSKSATINVEELAATEKAATITTQALGVALNVALSLGIGLAISFIVTEITKLINAEEEAKQKADEMRREASESADKHQQQAESIADLSQEYVKLATTTSKLEAEQKNLLSIQEQLNEGIANEKEQIDLLNGSLEENVEWLAKKRDEEAQDTIRDLGGDYQKALEFLDSQTLEFKDKDNLYYESAFERVTAILGSDKVKKSLSKSGGLQGFIIESGEGLEKDIELMDKLLSQYDDYLAGNPSKESAFGTMSQYDMVTQEYEIIKKISDEYREQYQQSLNIKNTFEAAEQSHNDYINGYVDNSPQRLQEITSQVEELTQKLSGDTSSQSKYILSQELEALKKEAYEIAGTNSSLKESVDLVFSAYDSGLAQTTKEFENLRSAWFTDLDDAEKNELSNIEAIKKALQSLAEGEGIEEKDFFDILKLDTDQILTDIKFVDGEATASIESMMALKDSYIQNQIDKYQANIDEIKETHSTELENLAQYEEELKQIQDEIRQENIDINQTIYGNINTDARELLTWTDENLKKYADAIESWGMTQDELSETISTVLGSVDEFNGIDIAFSPILQTPDGAVLLDKDTVYKYITALLESVGDNWTNEDLFRLDTKGIAIDGVVVKNILADIGVTAEQTSKAMHYVGSDGALASARKAFEEGTAAAQEYNDVIFTNTVMIEYLNSLLGNTIDEQKALKALSDEASKKADGLLKAQQYQIDQIIQGYTDEKTAIEDARDELKKQLETLEEQEKVLEKIKENYETAADVVSEAIQEQIDKLKEENEEREDALDLAEKMANLNNAKNNKVRSYTEAGGWTYEAKKADVLQAEKELQKSQNEERIKQLEAYQKKWSKLTNKAQKAADERTTTEILGADWREKIALQDEDIFDMYDEEYQKYCEQLYQVSDVEMKTLKDEIEVKDKEVKAKEEQIKSWQRYKTEVTNAANQAKSATEDWYRYLSGVTLSESSTLDEREENLRNFKTEYGRLIEEIAGYSNQIANLPNMSVGVDTSSLKSAADELKEFFDAYRLGVEAMAEAYDADENHFGLINSEWDAKLLKAAKGMQLVHSAATGRVVDYTGLLAVHGTKQKSETIFNANDSAKLYDLVHNTPNLIASMLTDGTKIAQGMQKNVDNSGNITFNGTTINLPNVQNPEQFARQMEMYMQTVLSESQVYKPRR